MAGTVSIANSQRLDITNGRLLSGGKLYFFAAGSTTPQLAYRDSGLTLPHPNPITLASDGMIPDLYFADGSIRCRLLNSAGVVQFDRDNMLVNGPSSGGGGGGATDPNAIFQTGDVMWLDVTGLRAGWVRDNGRQIGSSTSGANERANPDCQALFLYLWSNFSDALCPVSAGRGANALADWGANKQITLPNKRGYSLGGLTDMGNADSGALANIPFTQGNATTPGSRGGEATHALIIPELPIVTPQGTVVLDDGGQAVIASGGGLNGFSSGTRGTANITGSTFHGAPFGGGTAHNNTSLIVLGTFYRKL